MAAGHPHVIGSEKAPSEEEGRQSSQSATGAQPGDGRRSTNRPRAPHDTPRSERRTTSENEREAGREQQRESWKDRAGRARAGPGWDRYDGSA